MAEREIEPVDPETYGAFSGFVEEIDEDDPLRLNILTPIERSQYLDTEAERRLYQSSFFAAGVINQVKNLAMGTSEKMERESVHEGIGFRISERDLDLACNLTQKIHSFMINPARVEKFYSRYQIPKNTFVFDRVPCEGKTDIENPDQLGIDDTLTIGLSMATLEMDRRLGREFKKETQKKRFEKLVPLAEKDLTGVSYLLRSYLPDLEEGYQAITTNLEKIDKMDGSKIPDIVIALSYPSALFTVDMYKQVAKEYLRIKK